MLQVKLTSRASVKSTPIKKVSGFFWCSCAWNCFAVIKSEKRRIAAKLWWIGSKRQKTKGFKFWRPFWNLIYFKVANDTPRMSSIVIGQSHNELGKTSTTISPKISVEPDLFEVNKNGDYQPNNLTIFRVEMTTDLTWSRVLVIQKYWMNWIMQHKSALSRSRFRQWLLKFPRKYYFLLLYTDWIHFV